MSVDWLLTERDDPVATVIINRPDRQNAMSRVMFERLYDMMRNLGDDAAVRVIIIRGAGRAAFSAGGDIAEMAKSGPLDARIRSDVGAADRCLQAIKDCPKPVIAMVFGHALGGGCGLALACDLRVAGESAKFGIPAAKLGIVYPVEATASLMALVGPANAARILFTGAIFDSQNSQAMGIATIVFPDDCLEEETHALARQMARNAPFSIAGAKRIIQSCLHDPHFARDRDLQDLSIRSLMTEDHREGVRAFMEKRHPVFRGV